MTVAEERRCSRCYTFYPAFLVEDAFRSNRGLNALSPSARSICRPCEQTKRVEAKRGNRWSAKARSLIGRHANSLGVTKERLINEYGWDARQIEDDARYQYENVCGYCRHPYKDMAHGPSDLTLDVIDRDRLPYYSTNTLWCCATCNRAKGISTPESFERRRLVYKLWAVRKPYDPIYDDEGSLFNATNGYLAA
jgi:hypothetical protein